MKTSQIYSLGLPEQVKVAAILGIGHPAEQKAPVPAEKLQREKFIKLKER